MFLVQFHPDSSPVLDEVVDTGGVFIVAAVGEGLGEEFILYVGWYIPPYLILLAVAASLVAYPALCPDWARVVGPTGLATVMSNMSEEDLNSSYP